MISNFEDAVKLIPVLGTYSGECADADITNANGLDITREVWSTVFSSDAYKKALKNGWYIGFLGHPEDPNCMDFKNACIIMRSGELQSNGKIYGTFDLIDTPVGRIVKAFQDAGVVFGISVRGAGDIINNSVDPETFVFRGFDLVTFPAYPNAIPTFSAIAASTDVEKQAKYKAVCAAIQTNISEIDQKAALSELKAQFAPQSDEYKTICEKEEELSKSADDTELTEDVLKQKLEGMTQLYLEEVEANTKLTLELSGLSEKMSEQSIEAAKKLKSLRKLYAEQNAEIHRYESVCSETDVKLDNLSQLNLKYKQKVKSTQEQLKDKDAIIASLRSKLSETVSTVDELKKRTSNLDADNQRLKADVTASQRIIEQYQDAYVSLYSSAVGVYPQNISVTASTSVDELKTIIRQSANAESAVAKYGSNNYVNIECIDAPDDESDLVSL